MEGHRRRRLVAAATTILAVAAAGLVYAAWTTNGSGSGYARATSAQDLATVDVSATASPDLYPGANGDVKLEIDNPNPYPVRVSAVAGDGAITADAGHASCVTTGVTFTDQADLEIDVDASSRSQATLPDAAHMSNASDNGCQGATFTIPVSLAGASR